ncbi:alpha/beta hydrolase [Criblamydia sequanensis]|uniref:Alpha/beta hydrolase domain-containing protein n=1 Tax=Candidatus Criblamydia sequanensis CRIB-18 TaxID=1437425 RepID=A0A090E048_9BACT|nr:alpha/beta hydrolase [Criblamydia sequanensis]CDR34214.1 Alpha/beta hydrolase domain-containing protein [Criblamydia sequanensis CRIB-18]
MKKNLTNTLKISIVGILLLSSFFFLKRDEITKESFPDRHVPSREIPVPTNVSRELKKNIALPLNPLMYVEPKTREEWREIVEKGSGVVTQSLMSQANKLFKVEVKPEIMAEVKTHIVSPKNIPEKNKNRILVYIHGGGYILNGGEGSIPEAMAMAHYGEIKVISIDYRMLPDYPFPAGLDDVIAVYKQVLNQYKPENIGMFGTSAGAALTASAMLKLNDLNLPQPAVIGLGTPFSDISGIGDSYQTNQDIDNFLVKYNGLLRSIANLYTGKNDMKEPLISPVYGDFKKGFPPTILTTGTRDLFLSNTVRMHQKLREAGVEAYLQVFEGCSHAFYLQVLDSPESKQAYQEMVLFFDKHLGNS